MKNLLVTLLIVFGYLSGYTQSKPNIVFILADDLGYGDLGVNGQKKIKTPAIDQLAKTGMRFTNYYSGNTVCATSREAFLTGKMTANTFIRGNFLTDEKEDPPLPKEKFTIAEYLKQNGYNTALIGKWGLGGEQHGPNTQGFDYSFGYLDQIHAHNYYTDYLYENGIKIPILPNKEGKKEIYSADIMIDKALYYIDTINKRTPFFLYFAITLPHGAHDLKNEGIYSNEDWNPVFKKYAAMVSKLDASINLITQKLKEKGLSENTLVVFTSDNGANPQFASFFNSNYIFRGSKHTMEEYTYR